MRSIVVPVNYTDNAANAARYAADLALVIGADVHLLYVFEIPVSMSEVPAPETVYNELRDSGRDLLERLQQELTKRTFGKVRIGTDMETGVVQHEIKAFCASWKPLLVVMGASGGGTLENLLAGSNTIAALRHLHYPLLVVPGNATFKTIRKIVVACDRDDIDGGMPHALSFLKELSVLLGSELEVVHVLTAGESASEANFEYESWKNEVKTLSPALHFIKPSPVGQSITNYLKEYKADWLMVFPKKHSLFEFHRSSSKQLVGNSAVPVISLHA